MQTFGNFIRHDLINATLPLDTRQPGEFCRDNADTEMGFTALARARMPGVERTLIHNG